jgi:hypothetical protein
MVSRAARSTLRRRAAGLLEKQLWCRGRDVAWPVGNVLPSLGMCGFRPPGPGGGTAYTGRIAGDGVVWILYSRDAVLGVGQTGQRLPRRSTGQQQRHTAGWAVVLSLEPA